MRCPLMHPVVSRGSAMPVKRELWIPAYGEQHLCAKLKLSDIQRIKAKKQSGVPQIEIAREMGVSPSQVSRILTGKRWVRAMAGSLSCRT